MSRSPWLSILAAIGLTAVTPAGGSVSAVTGADSPVDEASVDSIDPVGAGSPLILELGQIQALLYAQEPASFGGVWVDSAGTPTIAVAGDSHPILDDAIRDLSVTPRVVQVKYSEAELNVLHDQLRTHEKRELAVGGSQLVQIATDIVNNRVVASVVGPTDTLVEWVDETYGDAVVVVPVGEPIMATACTNSNCPSPLKAGLKVYNGGAFWCMGGFIMRTTGPKYWWSTAGHCTSGASGWHSPTETLQHPAGTNRGSVTYQGWFENSTADVALFQISSTQKSNILCRAVTCSLSNITSREDGSFDVVGQSIRWQRQTGYSAGTLTNRNVSVQVCKPGGPCRWLLWQRTTTAVSSPGDSGGPVFSPSNTMAIGFISTTHSYSHISSLEVQASVQTQLTP